MSAPRPLDQWHGQQRTWWRRADGATSSSLLELVDAESLLDADGLLAALGLRPSSTWSVFRGVRLVGGAPAPVPRTSPWPSPSTLHQALRTAMQSLGPAGRKQAPPAVAVGGGLDSAVVAALARRLYGVKVPLLTLRTGISAYDEVHRARQLAEHLGLTLHVVESSPEALVELASQGVAATGCPLWNLHPLTRLALAEGAAVRGHRALLTGDGADPLFRGVPDDDYVPLVVALGAAAGLETRSPFFHPEVSQAILAGAPEPAKAALRQVAEELDLPEAFTRPPKRSRLLPELALPVHAASMEQTRERVARIGIDPEDLPCTGLATLALLLQQVPGAA